MGKIAGAILLKKQNSSKYVSNNVENNDDYKHTNDADLKSDYNYTSI